MKVGLTAVTASPLALDVVAMCQLFTLYSQDARSMWDRPFDCFRPWSGLGSEGRYHYLLRKTPRRRRSRQLGRAQRGAR